MKNKFNNEKAYYLYLLIRKSEEKIIDLIKSKINLTSKEINTKEAEKIIAEFNKPNIDSEKSKTTSPTKNKSKSKKISKK